MSVSLCKQQQNNSFLYIVDINIIHRNNYISEIWLRFIFRLFFRMGLFLFLKWTIWSVGYSGSAHHYFSWWNHMQTPWSHGGLKSSASAGAVWLRRWRPSCTCSRAGQRLDDVVFFLYSTQLFLYLNLHAHPYMTKAERWPTDPLACVTKKIIGCSTTATMIETGPIVKMMTRSTIALARTVKLGIKN